MTNPAQWIGNAGVPVNGDWTDVADWTTNGTTPLGSVPGVNNAVVLQDGTVTYNTTDEISSITGGVLNMTGGSLTIDNTSSGANIDVGTGASLIAASGAIVSVAGTISGTLGGAGAFVLDGGANVGSGADLAVQNLTLNGATVSASLSYAGASLTVDGSGLAPGAVDAAVTNGATLTVTSGEIKIVNGGQFLANGNGTLDLQSNITGDGTGVILLASGGTADIHNFAGGTVVFLDGRGDLKLEQPLTFGGTIAGFQPGDKIDLVGTKVTGVSLTGATPAGGDLVVMDGTTVVANLQLEGNYLTGFNFGYVADASGTGNDIVFSPACYRRGTRIQTAHGEELIEHLAIGDSVVSMSGDLMPIRWIGRRSYSGWFTAGNSEVLPVLIRAGALAHGLPRRDLWVSPEHAMYLDGMLIAARDLVNGESIIQEQAVDEVTYFHLEFDAHAVILAEGAPSESFVDDESRETFENAAEFHRLHPHAVRKPALFCAPRVEEGWELETVRRRLAVRAANVATVLSCEPMPVRGHVTSQQQSLV